VILPPAAFIDAHRPFADALRGPGYLEAVHQGISSFFLATDDPARKEQIIASLPKSSQHVLISAFKNHVTEYDAAAAALACRVPVAYIGAAVSMVDLARFRAACPQLVIGQTLGSGHFSPLFVPDQINAMLARFLEVYVPRAVAN
jgi:hypothetical protein